MHIVAAASVCLLASVMLVGCGGSHDGLAEDGGRVSYYSAPDFRKFQLLSVLAFEGGLTYGFYQSDFTASPTPEFAYQGFFVARPAAGEGGTELQGIEFNFDELTASTIRLRTAGTDESTFRAVLSDRDSGTPETIVASSASVGTLPTDPSALAGTYTVQARSSAASIFGTATAGYSGDLKIELSSTCAAEATLKPRPLGNLYDVTAQFVGRCALGGGPYTGHGVQAYSTGNVYLLLTKPSGIGLLLLLSRA